jgi:tRNA pseudouridine38-40 synthase
MHHPHHHKKTIRYFIELAYKGTAYAGFQVQDNANSIQAEVEKALQILFKAPFTLTGSSRTDAGVHAWQNYFHVDSDILPESSETLQRKVYNLNAILPADIVVKRILPMHSEAHCRFDAVGRHYQYFIYQQKNPFQQDRAFFYPYTLELTWLQQAADLLLQHSNFTSFSKKNTQVNNFVCHLSHSQWQPTADGFVYSVKGNRFLRGMVRGLVGTMLRVGTGKISIADFEQIIVNQDCSGADFSVPPQGLFLTAVHFPEKYFEQVHGGNDSLNR